MPEPQPEVGGFKHTEKPKEPTVWKIEARCERRVRSCGHTEYVTVEVAYGQRSHLREAEFDLLWTIASEEKCEDCLAGKPPAGPSLFIKPNRPPEAKPHG